MKKALLVLVLTASLGTATFAQVPAGWSIKQKARDSASQQSEAARQTNKVQGSSGSASKPATKTTTKPATRPANTKTTARPTSTATTAPTGAASGLTTSAHQAALTGDLAGLQAFTGNLNARDDAGKTPLYLAAWKGNRDAVVFLLERQADLSVADPLGLTPLHAAASNGHGEVLVLLLDAGADPNAVSKDNGQTPLHRAAAQGRKAAVETLLARGARKDAVDSSGKTPAQLAEYYQQNDWQDVMDAIKHAP